MEERTLILIRHAHRDTSDRQANNGLSEKGHLQAQKLAKTLERIFSTQGMFPESMKIISSPKLRCTETLAPLCKAAQIKLTQEPLLLERQSAESTEEFHNRVEQFLKKWETKEHALTVVCSHGDWLPLAIHRLTGARSEFKKGAWAEIKFSGNLPVLLFRN